LAILATLESLDQVFPPILDPSPGPVRL